MEMKSFINANIILRYQFSKKSDRFNRGRGQPGPSQTLPRRTREARARRDRPARGQRFPESPGPPLPFDGMLRMFCITACGRVRACVLNRV